MSTYRASCADRFGRTPKLHGRKSASSTIFTAVCTIRSRTEGMGKRPLLAPHARLGDINPTRGRRTIAAPLQLGSQLAELPGDPALLDRGQGDLVNARRAVIAPASSPLPEVTGYRTPRSGGDSAGHRAGEGLPSSRRHP